MFSRLVIISGLSGSGKSTALHALEDLGYYPIDNLPIKLFEKLSEFLFEGNNEINKLALVMDLRDRAFVENYPYVFNKILGTYKNTEIIFLEASDEVLIQRFSETRRKHPLSDQDVAQGIALERKSFSQLKEMATTLIDTSNMNTHALNKRITEQFQSAGLAHKMHVHIVSFGFKYGLPKNCDLVLDVRFLTNPHFNLELRGLTGLDQKVQAFIEKDQRLKPFMEKTESFLEFLIPLYAQEGKSYLTVGVGCTGGQHRSIYVASLLTQKLKELFTDYPVFVDHQEINRISKIEFKEPH